MHEFMVVIHRAAVHAPLSERGYASDFAALFIGALVGGRGATGVMGFVLRIVGHAAS